jgi:hypothetical protein
VVVAAVNHVGLLDPERSTAFPCRRIRDNLIDMAPLGRKTWSDGLEVHLRRRKNSLDFPPVMRNK